LLLLVGSLYLNHWDARRRNEPERRIATTGVQLFTRDQTPSRLVLAGYHHPSNLVVGHDGEPTRRYGSLRFWQSCDDWSAAEATVNCQTPRWKLSLPGGMPAAPKIVRLAQRALFPLCGPPESRTRSICASQDERLAGGRHNPAHSARVWRHATNSPDSARAGGRGVVALVEMRAQAAARRCSGAPPLSRLRPATAVPPISAPPQKIAKMWDMPAHQQ